MNAWLEIGLSNAVVATALAGAGVVPDAHRAPEVRLRAVVAGAGQVARARRGARLDDVSDDDSAERASPGFASCG